MNTITTITEILGWCSVINIAMLLFATIAIITLRDFIEKIHGKMFRLNGEELSRVYIQYLGHYKLAILVFNLAPYIALKIVA